MKIAVLGGTGDFGVGLVMRWAGEHEIIIGSRGADRAGKAAEEITRILRDRGVEADIRGMENGDAVEESDLVVLSIPYNSTKTMVEELKGRFNDQIVVSPIVPMNRVGKRYMYTPPAEGSAALLIQKILPPSVRIVSAFHTVSSKAIRDMDNLLMGDVIIAGDDQESKRIVADLVRAIRDLRPLDGGDLKVAAQIEGITPLLLNLAKVNGNVIKCPGIAVVLSCPTEKKIESCHL
ncbi:NADPH-dependent F420 reductase [Candidatus Methanocrinis natronophilus]|uniref:NADPH-dependent F420 reductase n=1 Tax=Candidatus Methanocrinis natronophilus TaxID=3033396 RepID=A0ABT5X6T9_9EURY|nr:NADPH-dependent F420 reductase [Candidatus Methanocrinis natronophilus]MDF0590368.1 NADPH-dependent F420 reductase [Candidatus Methanocrinis natronophilus]